MKTDIYQEVTDKIVAAIESGTADPKHFKLPWHQSTATGLPGNAVTGADYNGINVINLWVDAQIKVYATNQWASYKQWQSIDAQVRSGEKGSFVVFTKTLTKDTGETDPVTGAEKVDTFRMMKWSKIFNADQVDGYQVADLKRPALAERLEHAERFVTGTRADVRHGGQRAYYSPELDFVQMPDIDLFRGTETSNATEGYYSTFLHELTHWTGHASRLERDTGKRFKTESYAMEELVAELGSAYLCAKLGITPELREDHGHYIANWLEALKSDKRAIFTAASMATKAVDYLQSLQSSALQLAA